MTTPGTILSKTIAAVLIAAMPVSSTLAAVRPNAAVPTAGATAVIAQDGDEAGFGVAWAALAVIALAVVVAIWIAVDDDSDGQGSISFG